MDRRIQEMFGSVSPPSLSTEERSLGRSAVCGFMKKCPAKSAGEGSLASSLSGYGAAALFPGERRGILERMRTYMKFVPMSASKMEARVINTEGSVFEQIAAMMHFLSLRKFPMIAAVVLVAFGGTATLSYASQGTLPGDALYPLKIHIAEHPYVHLKFAQSARAEWEEMLAERRLDEAESLAVKGGLTEDARIALSRHYAGHVQRASAYKGGPVVTEDFEAMLDSREAALRSLVEERGEADVQLRVLLDRLQHAKRATAVRAAPATSASGDVSRDASGVTSRTATASSATSSADSASSVSTREAAVRQIDAANRRIEQVRFYLQSVTDDVRAETLGEAQSRLSSAAMALGQANAKLDADAINDAEQLARKASLISQEAKLLVRAEGELKVDLLEPLKP